jgi:hypothetical protein
VILDHGVVVYPNRSLLWFVESDYRVGNNFFKTNMFFISANINSAGFCNSIGEVMILLPLVTHVLLDWASGGMERGKMAGVG